MARHRLTVTLCLALAAGAVVTAKIKTWAQGDPQFDVKSVKTWGWDASGKGDVKMARSSQDDPKAIQKRFEPLLVEAVVRELAAIGLKDGGENPDVRFHYYLLVTVGTSTQTAGQFLPAVTDWGVPPFVPATTAFSVVQTGSIVLDAVSTKLGRVVWRGIGEAEIDSTDTDAQHGVKINEIVKQLAKKFATGKK